MMSYIYTYRIDIEETNIYILVRLNINITQSIPE